MDDVDVAGMAATGAIFRELAPEPARGTFTIVVTTDPYFENWARAIDLNFGARKHHGAPTRARRRPCWIGWRRSQVRTQVESRPQASP